MLGCKEHYSGLSASVFPWCPGSVSIAIVVLGSICLQATELFAYDLEQSPCGEKKLAGAADHLLLMDEVLGPVHDLASLWSLVFAYNSMSCA